MQREAAPSALAAARASQAATVTYDTLRAHGLHVPTLVDAAQPRARAARAGSDLIGSVVEETIQSEPELVKNAAGRWELRAPLPQSPPPPLKRPGAELAAALRTRLRQAEVAAVTAAPGSTFDVSRAVGAAATERDAEAAARARIRERRLAELAKAGASRARAPPR